jgi:hypothetical protein
MKRIVLYLLYTVSTCNLCCGDVTKFATAKSSGGGLAAEDRKILQDPSRFHEVHTISDLPGEIVALCAGDTGKIANPGQEWNATDAIIDPSLPGKRLIWAAFGGEYYVVHYERGGIAHTFNILVAKLPKDDAKPKQVWRTIGGPFKNYAAFVDALRSGKLDDRLDSAR